MKTQQSVFTKTWPENHPQTPPAEPRRSHFCGIFNQHLHLAASCTCVINKMRDLLSASSQKQSFCCKRQNSTSLCACLHVLHSEHQTSEDQNIHSASKVKSLWGNVDILAGFKGCWGLRLVFKVKVRNGFLLRASVRCLIVMVRIHSRNLRIDWIRKLTKTKINEW